MDWNRMNGPKMTEEQIEAYLARIGMAGPVPLTLEGLTAIHQAHQYTVPFENLDILLGRPLSLDHDALFDKLITRRRGGVCAELNTLYNWLLYSLGFDVRSFSSRIVGSGETVEFRRHRVLGVTFGEDTYSTDVGSTMEYARIPLLLKEGLVQDDGRCQYRYERDEVYGWLQYQKKPGLEWKALLGFTEEPQLDVDFILPMYYYEQHPTSVMNKVPRVSYYTEKGIFAIRASGGNTATKYLEEASGIIQKAVEITSREEENRLLRDLFRLDPEKI